MGGPEGSRTDCPRGPAWFAETGMVWAARSASYGAEAHQAVFHVHFHIIPKIGDQGLGILWPAGKLDGTTGADLRARIEAALAD